VALKVTRSLCSRLIRFTIRLGLTKGGVLVYDVLLGPTGRDGWPTRFTIRLGLTKRGVLVYDVLVGPT
jgi:hypothetical protein